MDLDETVVSLIVRVARPGTEPSPIHNLAEALTLVRYHWNGVDAKVIEIEIDQKRMFYVVRPGFDALMDKIGNHKLLICTHSIDSVAKALVNQLFPGVSEEDIYSRQQLGNCKELSDFVAVNWAEYYNIVILDDIVSNFANETIRKDHLRVFRPAVIPFKWHTNEKNLFQNVGQIDQILKQ